MATAPLPDKKPSSALAQPTRELFRLHGWRNFPTFVDGYFYFRFIDHYVGTLARLVAVIKRVMGRRNKFIFRPIFRAVAERYHGKILSHNDARQILNINEDVALPTSVSETMLPYSSANRIIFRHPEAIVAIDCTCRRAAKHDCQPANRCLIIGEPYASFVLAKAKNVNPRRLSQTEAQEVLDLCHRKGYVHNCYFKDGAGQQNYAICNCDPQCCASISAHKLLRALDIQHGPLATSGRKAEIDPVLCCGAEVCREVCPFDAIQANASGALTITSRCMGCGTCADACPQAAIVVHDPVAGLRPLEINRFRASGHAAEADRMSTSAAEGVPTAGSSFDNTSA